MCGTVVSPNRLEQIARDNFGISNSLRRTRSLQDLRNDILVEISATEQPRSLRRRISSVENLISLNKQILNAMAQTTEREQQIPSVAEAKIPDSSSLTEEHGSIPTASPPNSIRTSKDCDEDNCTGQCSTCSSIIDGMAAVTTASTSPEEPQQRNSPGIAVDKTSFFESPFFAAAQPSPNGISPRKPLIDSLKPPSAIETLPSARSSIDAAVNSPAMLTPRSKASLDLASVRSGALGLDGRRSSMDLGYVAPSSGHLGQGSAAVELFYRLNHARQTVDYVKRQAAHFSPLNLATMDVFEALEMLNSLREYESALIGGDSCDPDMPQLDHAFQTAEACRLAFPEHEWMPIVGLVHGLGKLLAHANFGAEPQWAVCGESFPVGCRFHPSVVHSQYFQANPDRRRRAYASPTGVYQPGCGLSAVCMSWSGAEYLYMVLARNRTLLPPEALFLIRYQKFAAVLRPGQPYGEMLSQFDKSMLPMLTKFRDLATYRRVELPGRMEGDEMHQYYVELLKKYIPQEQLRW